MSDLAPILLALYRKYYWPYVAPCAYTLGEAGRFRSANYKVFADFSYRCASPNSGVRVAAPIVLAQHKNMKE
jgi:hypothetical protein